MVNLNYSGREFMRKVLIVDDSKFIISEIKDIVTKLGYEVVGTAGTGEEGIKLFSELKPDIVTLDIIMPGIDGVETAQEIFKINPDAPIIMMSSLCDDETLEEIKAAGVKYWSVKPVDGPALEKILKKVEAECF